MNITGIQSLSTVAGGLGADDRDWSFEDTITWNKGKHVWKFGGELRTFGAFQGRIPDGTYGSFTFNGSITRSTIGYADFLLGIPGLRCCRVWPKRQVHHPWHSPDPIGAVVPQTEITATEVSTNTVARKANTDHNGNY
jgi:hypothetical protein